MLFSRLHNFSHAGVVPHLQLSAMKVELLLQGNCPWDVLAAVTGQCMPVVKLNPKLKIPFFQTPIKTKSASSRAQPEILPDAHVQKACGGKWRYSCTDVNLGTRWRNMVSFLSVTIYPRRKRHWSWMRANAGFDS